MRNPAAGRVEYYEATALGFGALRNVMSFNWVARALRHIVVVGLGIPIVHYFDD